MALLVCLALRLAYLLSVHGRIDSDEAVTWLMVRRISHGHLFVFFAGQRYMGALEQYLQAAVFAVLPQNSLDLRLPQLVLEVVVCGLVFVLARRCLGSLGLALAAALLFAVGPAYSIYLGVRSRGAYAASEVIALAGVLLALRLAPRTRGDRVIAAGFGLCFGLGVWENVQCCYLLLPAAIWALGTARFDLRRLMPPALAGLAVGSAPLLVWALSHERLPTLPSQPASSLAARAGHLFGPVLSGFLGLAMPDGDPLEGWLPARVLSGVLIGVFVIAIVRRRRGIAAVLRFSPAAREPIDLVLLTFALAPFLYVASPFAWYAGQPRYLFELYPLLPVALVALLPGNALGVSAAALLAAAIAGSSYLTLSRLPPPSPSERDLRATVLALVRSDARPVYADYWIAYPLQIAAGNRLALTPFTTPRFGVAAGATGETSRPAYVARSGSAARRIERALRRADVRYVERQEGSLVVFNHLDHAVSAVGLGLSNARATSLPRRGRRDDRAT
jgi:hypothetical protein